MQILNKINLSKKTCLFLQIFQITLKIKNFKRVFLELRIFWQKEEFKAQFYLKRQN